MKSKREKSPPEAVAANTEIKQEIYELAHAELSAQAETDAEIAPFIQKLQKSTPYCPGQAAGCRRRGD